MRVSRVCASALVSRVLLQSRCCPPKASHLSLYYILTTSRLLASKVIAKQQSSTDNIAFDSILEKIRSFHSQRKWQDLQVRPPVVTIMGHVDHGKTTLLDAIRKSEIVKQEHGGITQHIGAFVVSLNETSKRNKIEDLVVFLDTPGHRAFSSMRERGALVTDIVVLVVAADDGVMEQTVESISFARKANVPIIVAINKIDKIKNDPERIENLKVGLSAHGIRLEEDGGDIQSVRMSALQSVGIHELKETILALAETLELKSYVDGNVECSVVESKIDPHRGRLATVLVQKGTLKRGDLLVATNPAHKHISSAKVRAMFDEFGGIVNQATPGFPVQIIGWRDETLPEAGDTCWQMVSENQSKEVISMSKAYEKQMKESIDKETVQLKLDEHNKVYKAELKARQDANMKFKHKRATEARKKLISTEGDELKTSVVLKADVNGSLEVLLDIFDSFPNATCPAKLDLIHYGLGDVSQSDIELASCFPNGMIIAFNTGIFSPSILKQAKELNVPFKRFNVIYHLVDHLKEVVVDKLPMIEKEEVVGEALVIQEFIVTEKRKKIPVAGARCSKGVLKKNDVLYKLVRNGKVVASGLTIAVMRHHKDEVDTIKKDFDCGLMFKDTDSNNSNIRFCPQDTLVCYQLVKVKPQLSWTPKGF